MTYYILLLEITYAIIIVKPGPGSLAKFVIKSKPVLSAARQANKSRGKTLGQRMCLYLEGLLY